MKKKHLFLLSSALLVSFVLNITFNDWGLPGLWHPDEITDRSARLVLDGTANPRFFAYPSLHIYAVAGLVVGPYLIISDFLHFLSNTPQHGSELPKVVIQVTTYARLLSGFLGTATIFVVFLIGRKMFSSVAGVFAAAFLSVTAAMTHFSHFASVDIPMVFWCSLSFYMCLIAVNQSSERAYFLAALIIGLAISTKYTALLMLPTLLLAFLFSEQGRSWGRGMRRKLIRGIFLVLACGVSLGFVVGTPYALITPLDFMRDFIRLNFYQPIYAGMDSRGFIPHIFNLGEMMGIYLFVVSAAGFLYMLYLAAQTRRRDYILLIVTILVIYLKMGSMMFHPQRYILLLIPFLLLGAGKLTADVMETLRHRKSAKAAFWLVVGVGFGFSLYYSVNAVKEFRYGDRDLAYQFLVDNVPKNSSIEVSHNYGINRPEGYEKFRDLPYFHKKPVFYEIKQKELYQTFRRYYRRLRGKPTETSRVNELALLSEPSHVGLEMLLERAPYYLVLSANSYERFLSKEGERFFPLQHELYNKIFRGETPYVMIADFRRNDNWLTPRLEFVDAGVTIFQHKAPREGHN